MTRPSAQRRPSAPIIIATTGTIIADVVGMVAIAVVTSIKTNTNTVVKSASARIHRTLPQRLRSVRKNVESMAGRETTIAMTLTTSAGVTGTAEIVVVLKRTTSTARRANVSSGSG